MITHLLNWTEDQVIVDQNVRRIISTVELLDIPFTSPLLFHNSMVISSHPNIDWQELNTSFNSITMTILSKQDLWVDLICYVYGLIVGAFCS